jgi:CPA2 family monovalent cation:H+ antiporter-2
LLFSYLKIIAVNGVLLIAIGLLLFNFVLPYINGLEFNSNVKVFVNAMVSLGLDAPFIWAIMARKPEHPVYKDFWIKKKAYNHGPLLVIETLRLIAGILLIALWALFFFNPMVALLVVFPITLIVFKLFTKNIQTLYQRIEGRFITNISEREQVAFNTAAASVNRKNVEFENYLAPYDAHIVAMEVSPQAGYIGKELWQLGWREQYGINIVYIRRGEKLIHLPGRTNILLPFDEVGVLATDEQIITFKTIFEKQELTGNNDLRIDDIGIQQFAINDQHWLLGKTIRNSGVREKVNGLIVGIERGSDRILNPDSSTVFQTGDNVWIVGETKQMKILK